MCSMKGLRYHKVTSTNTSPVILNWRDKNCEIHTSWKKKRRKKKKQNKTEKGFSLEAYKCLKKKEKKER